MKRLWPNPVGSALFPVSLNGQERITESYTKACFLVDIIIRTTFNFQELKDYANFLNSIEVHRLNIFISI